MSNITAGTNFDQVDKKDLDKFLSLFGADVTGTVNGKLDFQTNMNVKLVNVTFSSINTDTAVTHKLGRVPVGYLIYSSTCTTVIFNGITPNTATTLYLQCAMLGSASMIVF